MNCQLCVGDRDAKYLCRGMPLCEEHKNARRKLEKLFIEQYVEERQNKDDEHD